MIQAIPEEPGEDTQKTGGLPNKIRSFLDTSISSTSASTKTTQ
jgi:hypothetical protein